MIKINIGLLITGGITIDGASANYENLDGKTAAQRWLESKPDLSVHTEALFSKDSREITLDDLALIKSAVLKSENDLIIITHGYLRIVETAQYLQKSLVGTNKLVLLIGAWKNFAEPGSDGPKNLEYALSILRDYKYRGVYICMDLKLIQPDQATLFLNNNAQYSFALE